MVLSTLCSQNYINDQWIALVHSLSKINKFKSLKTMTNCFKNGRMNNKVNHKIVHIRNKKELIIQQMAI